MRSVDNPVITSPVDRKHVAEWRKLPPGQWGVTPETQRLLEQSSPNAAHESLLPLREKVARSAG
ncbi:hypothetical protein DFR50_15123 [Roseiarcus fermentans]|uniref:Uncharacterized protein n=1 Tax=Roseiarcus fermentans TaxID=1473586 RepID=A0A366EJF0_9HYPH|nr:hypothetical protein [Roseiarcus fermentans]RBP02547.1 hypothetical protein DFR50_15123 [Roseiarcus fermentans]